MQSWQTGNLILVHAFDGIFIQNTRAVRADSTVDEGHKDLQEGMQVAERPSSAGVKLRRVDEWEVL